MWVFREAEDRGVRIWEQLKKKRKKKENKSAQRFSGSRQGVKQTLSPAARNVATLLTETFILAIDDRVRPWATRFQGQGSQGFAGLQIF